MALILGLLFTIVISGLVVSGSLVLRAHQQKVETSYRLHSQTAQFARAGLTEGLGWFRKQSSQPVLQFDPVLNINSTPPVLETIEPEIGIVREFQISGPIWGRYEVWKRWDQDPDPVRLVWRQKMQAEDVTAQSGASGVGNVWRMQSVSYVFRRVDPNQSFSSAPNQVLGTDILATEFRRLTLAPPGQAAVCSRTAGATTVISKVNIIGGIGAGIFVTAGSGSVAQISGPQISGAPGISGSTAYDDSLEAVFGVSQSDLRILADSVITSAPNFPFPVGAGRLYFVDVPQLTFDATKPLVGSAAVYVDGDVDFAAGSKSFFSGMLYVDGDLTMREPCEVNGAIIVTGSVRIEGSNDWVNISYDDGALNRLRAAIGQYRLAAAIRRTMSAE